MIILLAALVVAAGLLALGQTDWAAGAAGAVIIANQTPVSYTHLDQVMDGKHQGAAELFSSWFVVHRFSGFWRASGAR